MKTIYLFLIVIGVGVFLWFFGSPIFEFIGGLFNAIVFGLAPIWFFVAAWFFWINRENAPRRAHR